MVTGKIPKCAHILVSLELLLHAYLFLVKWTFLLMVPFLTLTKSSKSTQSSFTGAVIKLKLIHTPKPVRSAAESYTVTCVIVKTTAHAKINPRKL